MTETYINPSREQVDALNKLDLDGPLVMVNLLRFNPDGGAEAYARYGQEAAPFLQKAGAKVRYLGHMAATVIGGEEWDEIILVEYPSKAAFFEMTQNPDYPGDVRAGALLDSRLYCTQEASVMAGAKLGGSEPQLRPIPRRRSGDPSHKPRRSR